MFTTKNSLPLATRKKIIANLSALLSDAQDLYSQVKQAHWNVRGANFITLHQLFDAIGIEVNDGVDMIAERIMQLGGSTQGTIRVAAKQSRLKEYPLAASDGAKHVEALTAAIAQFTSYSRKAVDETGAAGDAITADMLTQITRGLDKQLWFIEAHNGK
jgi:starvation-inducible DNA-binding protein